MHADGSICLNRMGAFLHAKKTWKISDFYGFFCRKYTVY